MSPMESVVDANVEYKFPCPKKSGVLVSTTYDFTYNATQRVSFATLGQPTVQTITDLVSRLGRDRYRFTENEEGCRYWIYTFISDLEGADIVAAGSKGEAWNSLSGYWLHPPGSGLRFAGSLPASRPEQLIRNTRVHPASGIDPREPWRRDANHIPGFLKWTALEGAPSKRTSFFRPRGNRVNRGLISSRASGCLEKHPTQIQENVSQHSLPTHPQFSDTEKLCMDEYSNGERSGGGRRHLSHPTHEPAKLKCQTQSRKPAKVLPGFLQSLPMNPLHDDVKVVVPLDRPSDARHPDPKLTCTRHRLKHVHFLPPRVVFCY
ncbi:predicted protein [Histoplasma mississippiense (nom. inval.)]|uniref:predicted protein n=1 Tax=Ajellomyces capsulatus (strain NAm1 / WU24) TaxID=2059318 RepID=UPI000157BD1C|nr:predicted protein [Histoplasma mississippiense (nom. inval.)]EDN06263.1 predicted protein [Histoplasma mississippiense (nom. inval.)]